MESKLTYEKQLIKSDIWVGYLNLLIEDEWKFPIFSDYYTILRICLDFGFKSATFTTRSKDLETKHLKLKISEFKFICLENTSYISDCFIKKKS